MAETGRMPAAEIELDKVRASMPALLTSDLFWWKAYHDLSSDRPIAGESILSLPFSVLDRYAQRYNIQDTDFDDFCDVIRAMDDTDRSEARASRTKSAK